MRRSFVFFFAALVSALALTLSPLTTQTVHSGDIHERCEQCSVKNFEKFNNCLAKYGEQEMSCYDEYNEGVVHCYKNFCEQ